MAILKSLTIPRRVFLALFVVPMLLSSCVSSQQFEMERTRKEKLEGDVIYLNDVIATLRRDNRNLEADNRVLVKELEVEQYKNARLAREANELQQELTRTKEQVIYLKTFNQNSWGGFTVRPLD